MRLYTKAGVIVSLPAFPFKEATIEMLALVQVTLPRARFLTDMGDLISVLELSIVVEDIRALNPTTGS
jgi:hypothetical protein